uniref:Uncharacterized protein n=1 Tax=Globodera rostochiensis TaxID=31243 RepID=A0A914HL59_GLORO
MKGRWRPANSEHAETEQVVGRDGGRRKKSDERHWGASARGPAERARARPSAGPCADFFRSAESRPTYWPPSRIFRRKIFYTNFDQKGPPYRVLNFERFVISSTRGFECRHEIL